MVDAGHAAQTVPREDGRSRVVTLTAKGNRLAGGSSRAAAIASPP